MTNFDQLELRFQRLTDAFDESCPRIHSTLAMRQFNNRYRSRFSQHPVTSQVFKNYRI